MPTEEQPPSSAAPQATSTARPSSARLAVGRERLDALTGRLWGPSAPGGPVLATTGDLPAGYTLAEEYAVVPSLARARFLVPLDAPRAVEAAFTRHLSTVSARSRATGRVIAAGFRSGVARHLLRDRLRVGIDARLPQEDWRRHLVLSELAAQLDAPDLVGIHPVRRFTPNAKPTVRLFDRGGSALGYAKLGWSAPTRRLVRNEIAALEAVDGRVGRTEVPRVLVSGRWTAHADLDLEYVVTTALPPGLGPWRGTPATDVDLLLAVAESGDTWSGPWPESPYAAGVAARLDAAEAAQPDEVAALRAWFDMLRRRHDRLVMGRTHGDWVAWNLAATPGGGAVWDWEYSAPTAPLGFDLCHWHFQTSLAGASATLDTAAAALGARTSELGHLGLAPDAWPLVADLYVLEMLLRATGLAAEGSGWNPKLHPRLVSFARERASSRA